MAATTLTAVPASIRAGDTLLLEIGLSEYPASDSWTLYYDFRAANGTSITLTSAANNDSHLFTVSKSTTAYWNEGTYRGVGYVDNGTQRFTVWNGSLTILPDLTQKTDNYDTRTHAQKCLDAINAVLEGKATRDILSQTIAGQSISRMSFDELIRAKAYYSSLVDSELANEAAANGASSNRNILVRFTGP